MGRVLRGEDDVSATPPHRMASGTVLLMRHSADPVVRAQATTELLWRIRRASVDGRNEADVARAVGLTPRKVAALLAETRRP